MLRSVLCDKTNYLLFQSVASQKILNILICLKNISFTFGHRWIQVFVIFRSHGDWFENMQCACWFVTKHRLIYRTEVKITGINLVKWFSDLISGLPNSSVCLRLNLVWSHGSDNWFILVMQIYIYIFSSPLILFSLPVSLKSALEPISWQLTIQWRWFSKLQAW